MSRQLCGPRQSRRKPRRYRRLWRAIADRIATSMSFATRSSTSYTLTQSTLSLRCASPNKRPMQRRSEAVGLVEPEVNRLKRGLSSQRAPTSATRIPTTTRRSTQLVGRERDKSPAPRRNMPGFERQPNDRSTHFCEPIDRSGSGVLERVAGDGRLGLWRSNPTSNQLLKTTRR